jgi:hypothetical protein
MTTMPPDETAFEEAVADFEGAFKVVFRYDWQYTKAMIGDKAEGATFIEPGLEDEIDNWGARGALLEKYRALVAVMQAKGIEPSFPFSLEGLPGFKGRVW